MDSCSHCGKKRAVLKRCSVCKQIWYCGLECQNAGWKKHKKACAPPLSPFFAAHRALNPIWDKVRLAFADGDWPGVLEWEGRMEELLGGQSDSVCDDVLIYFLSAHKQLRISSTESEGREHTVKMVGVHERRVDLLGRMQLFRDQGREMCELAANLNYLGRRQEAEKQYERGRAVGAAHGFFSVECAACQGLGKMALENGRHEEGVDLLRNAVAAAPLIEEEDVFCELLALQALIRALFVTDAFEELDPLVPRYREAALAESIGKAGRLSPWRFDSHLFSAALHEVLCIFIPSLKPLHASMPLHATRPIAPITGFTARDKTPPFNPELYPGTREVSRGQGGGVCDARPPARERGSSSSRAAFVPRASP